MVHEVRDVRDDVRVIGSDRRDFNDPAVQKLDAFVGSQDPGLTHPGDTRRR
ncbi:hypothetical protein [Vulcanimicrobium alpinum]|uniref:hypothetical protein n=1 Tax=Vulcanimicrobium alpinum TaxID=3016050 RepID=UPI00295F16A7|nr:hypothetical protein [Vulcanimicrobium alpinum]